MQILLVEDDEKLGALVEYKLKQAFHTVDWVTDGESALSYMEVGQYDLYLLDWMLPGVTGVDLCQRRRAVGDGTPILILTARDAVADRVKGLKQGADDYLVKPFAVDELLARIEALGRRRGAPWQGEELQVGDLVLRKGDHTVARAGEPIILTRKEFQLLAYLMEHPGQILSRDQIINAVWGLAEVTPNAVDAMIRLLRKKIDEPFEAKYIYTYRGVGYAVRAGE
jgi:DNA-binding response OmpR family regulator